MDQPKITRLLRLIALMSSNKDYTVNELADMLDTSYRSIYRYIDTFKEAGFVVIKGDNNVYKLGKSAKAYRNVGQLIHFTEEEATIVDNLISSLDDSNMMKAELHKKLSSIYDLVPFVKIMGKKELSANIQTLVTAIKDKKMVLIENYSSTHSGVSDRIVEPFGFTANYQQLWCYEISSGKNKLFRTSRMGNIEMMESPWEHESEHREGYVDVFRFTGFDQIPIRLVLGPLAHNLILEEYPLSEKFIRKISAREQKALGITQGNRQWLFETNVNNLRGVGRFVIGLADDISVIDSPALSDYIRDFREKHLQ